MNKSTVVRNVVASKISTCYKENGKILEGIQEYSMLEAFKDWFGVYVNPHLVELKLLKKNQFFFILSVFNTEGNVFGDATQLFSLQALDENIDIKEYSTFEKIDSLFSTGLSERIVAETGFGNAFLLDPLLQRFLRTHGSISAREKHYSWGVEDRINEHWHKQFLESYYL